jgi:hypothetical protein
VKRESVFRLSFRTLDGGTEGDGAPAFMRLRSFTGLIFECAANLLRVPCLER